MAFSNEIHSFKKNSLCTTDTVLTKLDGTKVKEKSGESIPTDGGDFFVVDDSPDENLRHVIDGLFISSQDASANLQELKENKITHILNVAIGCQNHFKEHFTYKKLEILDIPEYDISKHFEECVGFIHEAITNGGQVLCHCNAGISRSSTIIGVYLMQKHEMSLQDALTAIRKNRPAARPNDGFMLSLKQYEEKLKKC
ncbi:uncharacterized protein [Clytia hemisphaerica]|uniref:Dual specificity protein phosphatase 19 n=1 Tax=Clytia hemisphaerica TaxID=252671 RepID=A0A7M6DQJ6_9CNID